MTDTARRRVFAVMVLVIVVMSAWFAVVMLDRSETRSECRDAGGVSARDSNTNNVLCIDAGAVIDLDVG